VYALYFKIKHELNLVSQSVTPPSDRNCFLTQVIVGKMEGRIEVPEDEEKEVCSYCMTFRNHKILESETGSTRLHPVEKSLWKILWTISKTDDMMSSCTV
jgi:hypothetical protein